MQMEYSYLLEEAVGTGLLTGLFSGTPSMLLSAVMYVFSALALYTIAKRRGIRKPWLAWIPVVNIWLIGSISDQYRYVVKGENRSKRKALLVLNLIYAALMILFVVFFVIMIVQLVIQSQGIVDEDALFMSLLKPIIGMGCVGVVLFGVAIAMIIVRYIAMYDVYMSMDPSNATLFLVLSILFSVTEPFFLFFNRHKDLGMPPRKEEPVYMPPAEPWENPVGDDL